MRNVLLITALAVALVFASWAPASGSTGLRWSIIHAGPREIAASGSHLALLQTGKLALYELRNGKLLWSVELAELKPGRNLAVDDFGVYVLSENGLHTFASDTGVRMGLRPFRGAHGLARHAGRLYFIDDKGARQLESRTQQQSGFAAGVMGQIEAAREHLIAVYRRLAPGSTKKSRNQLAVIDLRDGKERYRFRLLHDGDHRVTSLTGDRVSFLDFGGRPPSPAVKERKLYFTELDHRLGKKTKDLSLGKLFSDLAPDRFELSHFEPSTVFLVGFSSTGASRLLAYDLDQGKLLWQKELSLRASTMTVFLRRLWLLGRGANGDEALVINPVDGTLEQRHSLKGAAVEPLIAVGGQCVLVQTAGDISCFGVVTAATQPPVADSGRSPVREAALPAAAGPGIRITADPRIPGWNRVEDHYRKYSLLLPRTWVLDRDRIRALGGLRHVVPYARRGQTEAGPVYLGSVQVLIREAAGQDANGLWASVHAQRRGMAPDLRVHRVRRVGFGVLADYSFKQQGYWVHMASLCVVTDGRAYELRSWIAPGYHRRLWGEILNILRSFRAGRLQRETSHSERG
jgi:outer membrane protein assembly factor BamB